MRVVTLLPAATEIVAALGAADALVGISHECDYPSSITNLPRVTATHIDPHASGAEIDGEVRRLRSAGVPAIAVEVDALRRLAPDLIVTQGLCEVCAVEDGAVHRLATSLRPLPEVLSLGATTVTGIEEDIRALGRALHRERRAKAVSEKLGERLDRLRATAREPRPSVLCIEWLDPLYLAGHWVPELVDAAGGRDIGAAPGSHSAIRGWKEVGALGAELIVVMLCGFDVERSRRELDAVRAPEARRVLASAPVWLLDGNAYTSRPGPRVVEGAERIRAAIEGREVPGLAQWVPIWPTA
jgi:iron complex transport system substrate-binding protein